MEGAFPARRWARRAFRWKAHAKYYDYFLTRGEPHGMFDRRKNLELVIHRGKWRLWKKKPPG